MHEVHAETRYTFRPAIDSAPGCLLEWQGSECFAEMANHETYVNHVEYPTDGRNVHNKGPIGMAQLKRLAVLAAYKSGWLFFVRPSVIQEYLSQVQNAGGARGLHGEAEE